MQFTYNDNIITLKGMQEGTIHLATKKQVARLPIRRSAATLLLAEKSPIQLMFILSKKEKDEIFAI